MLKKLYLISIFSFILLLFIGIEPVSAEEWSQDNVRTDNVWTVAFNTEMDPESINERTIYITDSTGAKLTNVDVTLDYSLRKVKVDYKDYYTYGESYNLVVTDEVRSEAGKGAATSSNMSFVVEENPNKSAADIIAEVDEKVVTVEVKTSEYTSQGSGVVVGDGLILTNQHVINEIQQGTVTFTDGTILDIAGIVEMDVEKDLALIKTTEPFEQSPVRIGTVDSLSKGDPVIAIGSPKGLSNSASQGNVSAFREENGVKRIQIDAEIDHGSSGGGLFDDQANLVGITSSGIDSNAALNFAVAIDEAMVWEDYLSMDYSSIPINYPLSYANEPTPSDNIFSYGDVSIGMTRQEVLDAEDAVLSGETANQLIYTNNGFYGYAATVIYQFENDLLHNIYIYLNDVTSYSFEELEVLFDELYANMERDIGAADEYDLDWNNDPVDYRLSAFWWQDPELMLSVVVDEADSESAAVILIEKQ